MEPRSVAPRRLTRQQVLEWRSENWSYTDKAFIAHALDVLEADEVEYLEQRDGSEIAARIAGTKVFAVRPGFVYWPKGTWAIDVDGSLIPRGLLVGGEGDGTMWAALSTLRAGGGPQKTTRVRPVCASCSIELPATGVCDNC